MPVMPGSPPVMPGPKKMTKKQPRDLSLDESSCCQWFSAVKHSEPEAESSLVQRPGILWCPFGHNWWYLGLSNFVHLYIIYIHIHIAYIMSISHVNIHFFWNLVVTCEGHHVVTPPIRTLKLLKLHGYVFYGTIGAPIRLFRLRRSGTLSVLRKIRFAQNETRKETIVKYCIYI